MYHPAGRAVLEQREHFLVVEGIAPASDNRQQFLAGAEPFQGSVALAVPDRERSARPCT
jgi:hypothetical protein